MNQIITTNFWAYVVVAAVFEIAILNALLYAFISKLTERGHHQSCIDPHVTPKWAMPKNRQKFAAYNPKFDLEKQMKGEAEESFPEKVYSEEQEKEFKEMLKHTT